MKLSEIEIKRLEKNLETFLEKRRPPMHLRDKVDLGYHIDRDSIVIFETRLAWNDPSRRIEQPTAKAKYIQKTKTWKIYWMRADLKWHSYPPVPEVESFEEFLRIVDEDENACFWG